MHFENLANELVLHIFHSCNSTQDVRSLACVNHRFTMLFSGSQKLPVLLSAAENQYGPLQDAIQVVTYNASQPAHLIRRAPTSLALIKSLLELGAAAQKWADIYPAKKWKFDFENRRLLTSDEAYRIRRAIYRLWLYSRAFHNARYSRTTRTLRPVVLERAELLHNWTTAELAEMEDVRDVIREVVKAHVCPSNGTIQRKFRKRFPDSDQQLLFNIHLNYPPPPSQAMTAAAAALASPSPASPAATFFSPHYHCAHPLSSSSSASLLKHRAAAWQHEAAGAEGWGDDIPHYYVVQDMLKLDPGQIVFLREHAPLKGMVEGFVRGLGEWFENNGETLGQTLEWVLEQQRGLSAEEFRQAIAEREAGVVIELE